MLLTLSYPMYGMEYRNACSAQEPLDRKEHDYDGYGVWKVPEYDNLI
jgi:hypothetical protein